MDRLSRDAHNAHNLEKHLEMQGDRITERAWEQASHEADALSLWLETSAKISAQLEIIVSLLKEAILQKPIDQAFALQPSPNFRTLSTHGRKHTLIFCNGALSILLDVPGVGPSTLNLKNGWNVLELRDGWGIGLPAAAANPVNIVYRATDYDVANLYQG